MPAVISYSNSVWIADGNRFWGLDLKLKMRDFIGIR